MTSIFDIGKTNKKLFVFDDDLKVIYEKSVQLEETRDEDGFPCENLAELTRWMKSSLHELQTYSTFEIRKLNFSGYGASFVHLDKSGKPIAPLYNYLKPFPESLSEKFYYTYGGQQKIARETASPTLGHLNSGMQLYWLKNIHPDIFNEIGVSLHLPQYLSFVFSGHYFSDITSIGCHTQLWNFDKGRYHDWVFQEKMDRTLCPIAPSNSTISIEIENKSIACGIGLHDSSAALIPYLRKFKEPFMLLSTGTWCISLNPFNHSPLTASELNQDCLCYLSYEGTPVKASRLFSGHEHEQQVKILAEYYNKSENYYNKVPYQSSIKINSESEDNELSRFKTYEEAYHHFVASLIQKQVTSSQLVLKNQPVSRIFVDGGFSQNAVFMNLLARNFPGHQVYASSLAQASALGAALAIHEQSDQNLFEFPLKKY